MFLLQISSLITIKNHVYLYLDEEQCMVQDEEQCMLQDEEQCMVLFITKIYTGPHTHTQKKTIIFARFVEIYVFRCAGSEFVVRFTGITPKF